jgi:hypothetical protein
LHSAPLDGATVVVRNEATGAEARTTTAKNGSYRFTGLDAGAYTLEAESPQLGHGRLEGIFVAAGHEERVQAAMEFELAPGRPIQLAVHDIATVTPEVNAPVAVDTMEQLPLRGRRTADAAREMPPTVTAVVTEALAAETLWALPLTGRLSQDSESPAGAPAGVGRIGAEPAPAPLRASSQNTALRASAAKAQELAVVKAEFASATVVSGGLAGSAPGQGSAGRGSPGAGAPAAAGAASLGISWASQGGLATSETAPGAVQAAIEFNQPAPKRIQTASQRVDPVAPVVTTTVTAEQLQALPAQGRQWQNFVLDTPTAATPAGGTSQPSLRGAGQEPAETTIDNASTRLVFGGGGGSGPGSSGPGSNGQGGSGQNGMGQAWAGGHGAQVAEAAIRQVETAAGNAEAEGAKTAGGRMNVETQRGTNGLHGQGFFSDRQNTWGAQNPFTQWVKETAPATLITSPVFTPEPYTPPDHERVLGIGLGSQIRRDKLFWFGALDSYRRNDPGLATAKHPDEFFAQPSNDQMQVLSARLGLSGANPVGEGLKVYSTMLETLDGLLGPAPRTASQWVGFSRIDWEAAERHRFTLEGIGARWNSPGGGLTRVSESYGTNSFGSSQASEDWLMGRWEAFLTPNLLAVTQGSLGRNILSAHAETPSAYEQTFLSPNLWGQLPQMVVDSRYGFTIGNPSRFGPGSYPDERLYEAQESVDWVRGSLLVKAGFDVSHNSDATSLLRNQTGTYYYSNVENFASDALVFAAYGLSGELNRDNQHNCDLTGKVWRDSTGTLRGLGYLPCYSYYSQVMGPSNWHLSTNDWAGFVTTQWRPSKLLVVSGGLRWEREQLPPPIAALANPELPLTEKLASLGNNWGPRLSVALGNTEGHLPVLRLGYGMYFGRTENATVETALTQTGSPSGDLNFFLRPTDNLNAGGAPPFPYVLNGEPANMVKPGAVEFEPEFRNPEVHQAVAAVEEALPGRVEVTASALVSLGRRLPVSIDTNFDPAVNPGTITYAVVDGTGAGPIKTPQITVPFYASWPSATSETGFAGRLNPDYQQISEIMSRANSTYEAAMFKLVRYGRRGLSLHAHYTYAHAMDWNPNESTTVAGSDLLDPASFSQEYGTSNLDMRHSAAAMVIYEAPWKLRGTAGRLGNGWMVSGIGQFRSGLPYTMRTSGSLAEEFDETTGAAIVALGPGMNGSGGDNRVYGVGRNTYRYPTTWKADMRLGKSFDLGEMRKLELLVESFNLFNHQNVTELETTGYYLESGASGTLPSLNFLTGLKANTTAFGQPLNINATNFYRERQVQVGVRMRF